MVFWARSQGQVGCSQDCETAVGHGVQRKEKRHPRGKMALENKNQVASGADRQEMNIKDGL